MGEFINELEEIQELSDIPDYDGHILFPVMEYDLEELENENIPGNKSDKSEEEEDYDEDEEESIHIKSPTVMIREKESGMGISSWDWKPMFTEEVTAPDYYKENMIQERVQLVKKFITGNRAMKKLERTIKKGYMHYLGLNIPRKHIAYILFQGILNKGSIKADYGGRAPVACPDYDKYYKIAKKEGLTSPQAKRCVELKQYISKLSEKYSSQQDISDSEEDSEHQPSKLSQFYEIGGMEMRRRKGKRERFTPLDYGRSGIECKKEKKERDKAIESLYEIVEEICLDLEVSLTKNEGELKKVMREGGTLEKDEDIDNNIYEETNRGYEDIRRDMECKKRVFSYMNNHNYRENMPIEAKRRCIDKLGSSLSLSSIGKRKHYKMSGESGEYETPTGVPIEEAESKRLPPPGEKVWPRSWEIEKVEGELFTAPETLLSHSSTAHHNNSHIHPSSHASLSFMDSSNVAAIPHRQIFRGRPRGAQGIINPNYIPFGGGGRNSTSFAQRMLASHQLARQEINRSINANANININTNTNTNIHPRDRIRDGILGFGLNSNKRTKYMDTNKDWNPFHDDHNFGL